MASEMAIPPSLQQSAGVNLAGVDAAGIAAVDPAVAALVRYSSLIDAQPNCSGIHLSQTEFLGNVAVGGGGGAIFWNGPVDMLIVSCDSQEIVGRSCAHASVGLLQCVLVQGDADRNGMTQAWLKAWHDAKFNGQSPTCENQPLQTFPAQQMGQRCLKPALAGRGTIPHWVSGTT